MPDIRPLPKNERATHRIKHKHASYSPAGTLLCTVCHLQLKSDSLWDYHLRSAGHIMRMQELQLQAKTQHPEHEERQQEKTESAPGSESKAKKRKAGSDAEDTCRKRSRLPDDLPSNLVNPETVPASEPLVARPMNEIQIPSRPATPLKPSPSVKQEIVDEDEWAAFEADIAAAATLATTNTNTVISAPALSKADLTSHSREGSNEQRKAREEAEAEGDKEDAERKVEDEFNQMESLEARVRRLREKRETLRKYPVIVEVPAIKTGLFDILEGENDDDDDDDDEWDGFRMKG